MLKLVFQVKYNDSINLLRGIFNNNLKSRISYWDWHNIGRELIKIIF